MKVWGLLILLLFPGTVRAQQQYYGTTVGRLSIVGSSNQDDLQLLSLRPGQTITPENVRASIQTLYDTGHYRYIEVDATPTDGGTALTFQVTPHYYFSTFRLEPEDLLDRSISGFFRLPLGEKFSDVELNRIVTGTLDLLKAEGYFEAKVAPVLDFEETTRLVSVTLKADAQEKAKIGMVRIEGGEQTFSSRELLDALNMRAGHDFSADALEQAVSRVRDKFNKQGFLNTRVTVNQTYLPSTKTVDLTVGVQPGVFVLVQTRGYDISDKRLRQLVPVFEEGTVDPDLVEEGRVEVARFMQQEGYFEASVASEIIDAPFDNATQIIYNIEPGMLHRIRNIRIEGTQFFKVEELKRRMKIKKADLFGRGVYSADLLEQDVQTLLSMYRTSGFEGTEIHDRTEEINHEVEVVIEVREGMRYPIDSVNLLGNDSVTTEDLLSRAGLKEGEIYTPLIVESARNAITGRYYEHGFPDVRVEPSAEQGETHQGVHVTFKITEGEHYNIGQIFVAGNTLTKEKIVHRNSRLYADTSYNPETILEAQQRLYATGLFTRVEIVTLQQDLPGIRNLLIQVEDSKPILLTYGAGGQDSEGVRGTIEISHSNLFGLDRSISVRLRGSRREQRFQATYREPWLFNHDIDGFASLFIERTRQRAFDADRVDFSLQTLKKVSLWQNLLMTASYETVNLKDIRVNPRAEEFPEEGGVIQIARIGSSLIRDTRDDPINPNTGKFMTTTFQLASTALGSEVNFTSLFNQSSAFTPLGRGVFASSVRFGWNQTFGGTHQLPITERYFAGGSTTLRGFDQDEAGPEAGGNVMTIGNVEYRVPLPIFRINNLGGTLFYDTGNVFRRISEVKLSDFTHTAGFGVRYQTPLGPVRLDFGINLDPKIRLDGRREERTQVFFTLGHAF